jgi:hypothetical protein
MARKILSFAAIMAFFASAAQARLMTPSAPRSQTVCTTLADCRSQVMHLKRAVAWQKQRFQAAHPETSFTSIVHAIRLASMVFHTDSQHMLRTARCESHLNVYAHNPHSTATGLFQFLTSTWNSTPFGRAGFSIYDPYAQALATAQIVVHDHGYGQWVCG